MIGVEITAFDAPEDEAERERLAAMIESVRGAAAVSVLRPLVEELHERRAAAQLGGGEERIAKQHAAGKLTARERLALLIDDGTFTELGIHAGRTSPSARWRAARRPPTASSPATARSTAAWSRSAPTTSPSWPARWA